VSSEKFPARLTHEWADPYRAERIYKSLEGRDHLTPADLLAVQTDIYSEVDQELAHRFAYAIEHTPSADNRLKKAAELLRDWDGRLSTDSAAASIVTQTRRAFWPNPTLPRKRSSCTPLPTGFRRPTKTGTNCSQTPSARA
jgi:penicillin amidase